MLKQPLPLPAGSALPGQALVALPDRLIYLDSLRGLAALLVVLAHIGQFYHQNWDRWFNATVAVALFFVLSGLVLSRGYLRGHQLLLLPFLVTRFCRLWLPYVAALVLALGCASLARLTTQPTRPPMDPAMVERWLPAIPFMPMDVVDQAWSFYAPDLLLPSWTLRPEFVMSLWLPVLILVLLRSRWWAIAMVSYAWYNGYMPDLMLSFCLGIALAYFELPLSRFSDRTCLILLVLAGGMYAVVPPLSGPPQHELAPLVFWSFPAGALLIAVMSSARLQRLASHPALIMLGKISFSLYLIHYPLIGLCAPLLLRGLNGVGIEQFPAVALTTAVILVLCIAAARVFHAMVELHMLRFGKWLGLELRAIRLFKARA